MSLTWDKVEAALAIAASQLHSATPIEMWVKPDNVRNDDQHNNVFILISYVFLIVF